MIVRPRPSFISLLFIVRGSIVPQIVPKVAGIIAVAGVALLLDLWRPQLFERNTLAPFTLIGLTLSIFLSFRNNASYDRWWEARRLWGQLIVDVRSLARTITALLPDDQDGPVRQRLLRRCVGFCQALEARLREGDEAAAAAPWMPEAERPALTRGNPPQAILCLISANLAEARREGRFGDALHLGLEERLTSLAGVQAGCERIRYTPLPFAYTLLVHRTAYVFCLLLPFGLVGALGFWTPLAAAMVAYTLFGLDALGDELEQPFALTQNGLPLKSMVRTVEIDLLTALGEADIPPPLQPVDYVLH